MQKSYLKLLRFACQLFGTCGSLHAMQLKPLSAEFSPSGKDAVRSFVVKNDQDSPAAVLVTMAKRDVSLDGKESNPEVENDFSVYPSQIVLMPDEEQTIHVSWMGALPVSSELAYRLIAEQVAVDLNAEKKPTSSGFKIMFKYVAAVYVTPPQVSPHVIVESAVIEKKPTGERLLTLNLFNQGKAHQILKMPSFSVKAPVGQPPLSKAMAEQVEKTLFEAVKGTNMLALLKRQFSIPLPKEFQLDVIEVSAQFNAPS
ncbi:MAG: hypothetical protein K0S07_444 [Chlamydiales bacterium]|jgi:fimbrial chaperone protein|nr:hypothetical protein [Chlamydiales bacterium]